ncbi:MAG: cytochrome c family protein [Hyphomicrobiales bacterium]|nr:cytochrome c family protein [Hyphomicrobiales bacterium]
MKFAIGLVVGLGLAIASAPAFAGAGDPAAGETVFKKCAVCHSIGEGAKNKIGPILNGLEGRHSGSVEGYSYTDANKNSGITWDEANFKKYIENPKADIPGTKMIFAGLPNEKDRDDVWAYITQFKADGTKK